MLLTDPENKIISMWQMLKKNKSFLNEDTLILKVYVQQYICIRLFYRQFGQRKGLFLLLSIKKQAQLL